MRSYEIGGGAPPGLRVKVAVSVGYKPVADTYKQHVKHEGQRSRSSTREETDAADSGWEHLADSYQFDLVKHWQMIPVSTHFTSPYPDVCDYHTHLHN